MEKKNALIWILLLSLSCPLAAAGKEERNTCKGIWDAMPCHLTTISWVEVAFQGDLLKKHKSAFERLIRLRLRNDLSMYSQEVKSLDQLCKEKKCSNFEQPAFKKRGMVLCGVWTVGNDYPVAFFVECKLLGYGTYSNTMFNESEYRFLGFASASSVKGKVEEALRGVITEIAAELLERRDLFYK